MGGHWAQRRLFVIVQRRHDRLPRFTRSSVPSGSGAGPPGRARSPSAGLGGWFHSTLERYPLVFDGALRSVRLLANDANCWPTHYRHQGSGMCWRDVYFCDPHILSQRRTCDTWTVRYASTCPGAPTYRSIVRRSSTSSPTVQQPLTCRTRVPSPFRGICRNSRNRKPINLL
jgi:hypothetical protein